MIEKTVSFKLDKNSLDRVQKFDSSVRFHSTEYAQLNLQSQRILSMIASLEEAKTNFLVGVIKEKDIDPNHVVKLSVDSDGTISVLLNVPPKPDGKPDGEEKPPNPPATPPDPPSDTPQ